MILEYSKKLNPQLDDEQAVFHYMDSKDTELESDVEKRLFGERNKTGTGYRKAGYTILRDFYEGDQWFEPREAGSAMSVVNFVRMSVNNYTAFLTQEAPEIDIPPKDPKDDVELARVREVEQLINEIFTDNEFYNVYYGGVQNGSLLGDSMIVGPFYDEQKKRIWFRNIKKPEFIRVIWETEDYDRFVGFIYHYYMGVEATLAKWGDILKEKNIDLRAGKSNSLPLSGEQRGTDQEQRCLIREIWDDEIRLFAIDDHILKYDKHDQGFVPLIYVRNMPNPTGPWGDSDVEDLLDPQQAFNEQDSDMRDIIKQVAFASIFGKNLDVEEVVAGVAKMYDMGDEAEVFSDPRSTNYPFLQGYLQDKKQAVDITSGIPDVFQGGKGVRDVSGRALSVLMTPINNRVRGKENRWRIALQVLVKNIEILVEKYVPGGDELIQGHYKVDVFFPGTLVRDVTDELNKFIQKVQSQYTTMKNIGIASPKDEQELMKKELKDLQLAVELSRNPQMQLAIATQLVNQAQQNVAAKRNEAAGAEPTLNNGQNQGGETPASAPGNPTGSTVTPAGALAQAGSAGGQPPLIPNA